MREDGLEEALELRVRSSCETYIQSPVAQHLKRQQVNSRGRGSVSTTSAIFIGTKAPSSVVRERAEPNSKYR